MRAGAMIEGRELLPDYEQKRIDRLVQYMTLMKVDPVRYWIGPIARLDAHAGIAAAGFTQELDNNADSIALLKLPFVIDQPPLVTGLVSAVRYIVHLLSEPGVADRLARVNPRADDKEILENLGIDIAAACRSSLKAWSTGNFLAPDAGGFAYFLVEDRGQIVTLARSAALSPVAWAYAADEDKQRTNLSGRIGQVIQAS